MQNILKFLFFKVFFKNCEVCIFFLIKLFFTKKSFQVGWGWSQREYGESNRVSMESTNPRYTREQQYVQLENQQSIFFFFFFVNIFFKKKLFFLLQQNKRFSESHLLKNQLR